MIVQSDDLLGLSTVLVAPTSTSARAVVFRPRIVLDRMATLVMVDRTGPVDLRRLGRSAGRLDSGELVAVDEALALVLRHGRARTPLCSAPARAELGGGARGTCRRAGDVVEVGAGT